jgi:predicted nucleotidyltransferase
MINHGLSPEDLAIIHDILHDYNQVYIFGSRVKGTYKPFSDFDVCIKQPLADYQVELLNEKFTESDLPFKVDIVLYDQVSDEFKKRIDQESIPFSAFVNNNA